ncbi:hypothetical protein F4824DRAFT_460805 [Ustulina deusta]|nr:hypothetical protein F4824DRAFT_460805 [Ustulina deusta]
MLSVCRLAMLRLGISGPLARCDDDRGGIYTISRHCGRTPSSVDYWLILLASHVIISFGCPLWRSTRVADTT